jgi:hypothetical protein
MDQKTQFIADVLRGGLAIVELCDEYGISRKTGYKWIDRYLKDGPDGLRDRSRRPASNPNSTPPELVGAILEARHRHPSWGAKKLLKVLSGKHPRWPGRGARPCATSSNATDSLRSVSQWSRRCVSYLCPPNAAAVERPRDNASSAPRVHNEVTHMRHARDAL